MGFRDDWPTLSDGRDFDGKRLLEQLLFECFQAGLELIREGNSPFQKEWDVPLLIREIEENLSLKILDIPLVSEGSNNYVR